VHAPSPRCLAGGLAPASSFNDFVGEVISRRSSHLASRSACSSSDGACEHDTAKGTVPQPAFPEDARLNAERQAVEFEVEIGEYRGVVRVPRRVFQPLLPERPTPERCVEAYYRQRTRFESIAERSLADVSCPRMGTWRSAGGTCGRGPARGAAEDRRLRRGRYRVTHGPHEVCAAY
jgi:hypothetical protein